MKKALTLLFFIMVSSLSMHAQSDCLNNSEELSTLIKNKYSNLLIDGANYVTVGGCRYIVGIGTCSTQSKSNSVMARMSSVKARREIMLLLGKAKITSEAVMTTEQIIKSDEVQYYERYFDRIEESAAAFVSGMPMLTSFISSDGTTFGYVLYKPLN